MAKKKILLLSDDLRMSSGVGTMSKEIVFGTVQKYDWVQIGGAIKHPDEGKFADISDESLKNVYTLFSVGHFWVKLKAIVVFFWVRKTGNFTIIR